MHTFNQFYSIQTTPHNIDPKVSIQSLVLLKIILISKVNEGSIIKFERITKIDQNVQEIMDWLE